MLGRQCSRWLCLFALMLMGGVFLPASAQSKDVITFTGGHADPDNPGIYVIDAGPDDVIVDPDGGNDKIRIKLSRPQGATATQEANIILNNLNNPLATHITVGIALLAEGLMKHCVVLCTVQKKQKNNPGFRSAEDV